MYRPPQDKQLEHLTRSFTASFPKTQAAGNSPQQRPKSQAWWVLAAIVLTIASIIAATMMLVWTK